MGKSEVHNGSVIMLFVLVVMNLARALGWL
jgi:hypothetical protein